MAITREAVADSVPTGTMSGMARKADKPDKGDDDKPRKVGRPATGRKPTRTIFARVPPYLGDALDVYLDGLRIRPNLTAVVIKALEEFLRGEGALPTDAPP